MYTWFEKNSCNENIFSFSSIFWIGEMGAGWITKFVMANYWIYPPPPTHYYWALPYVQNIFTCLQFIQLTSLPKPHHHYPLPIQDVSSVCDQYSAVILHQNHSCKGHLHEKLYYIRLAEKNSSTPFTPKFSHALPVKNEFWWNLHGPNFITSW